MRRFRARSFHVLAWVGLTFLALRPSPLVQAVVDGLVAPLRAVGEMARPLELVRRRSVVAAEHRLSRGAEEEARMQASVREAMRRIARPVTHRLPAGWRSEPGEVVGRHPRRRDVLRVWVGEVAGLEPDLPVAVGDAYVGRVLSVPSSVHQGPAAIEVELVTSRGFFVGARVDEGPHGEPVLLTVGGVDTEVGASEPEVRLAVHNPSDRELRTGLARVFELFFDAEPFAEAAEGLLLGEVRYDEGMERWSLLPELDYLDGLFHVMVFAPRLPGRDGEGSDDSPLVADADWVRARPIGLGDPSPWRRAVPIRGGWMHGVRDGAAVTSIGARLVGRVTRAGPWSSHVSFLADPGFHVSVLALFDGDEEPRALGRFVSVGAGADENTVRFRWIPRVAWTLGQEGPLMRARLFTGSGDLGMPSGFFLGEASLPVEVRAGETYILTISTDVEPAEVGALFVRTAARWEPRL